jgi:hypothetical protein
MLPVYQIHLLHEIFFHNFKRFNKIIIFYNIQNLSRL